MTDEEFQQALQLKQAAIDGLARSSEMLLREVARAAKELPHDPNAAHAILVGVLENCDAEDLLKENTK